MKILYTYEDDNTKAVVYREQAVRILEITDTSTGAVRSKELKDWVTHNPEIEHIILGLKSKKGKSIPVAFCYNCKRLILNPNRAYCDDCRSECSKRDDELLKNAPVEFFEDLSIGIVKDLISQYRAALIAKEKHEKWLEENQDTADYEEVEKNKIRLNQNKATIDYCEHWLKSDNFKMLSALDPLKIIATVRRELYEQKNN